MKKTVAGLLAAALVFTAGGGALLCAGQAGALRKTAAGGAHTDLSTGSDLRLDYDSESRSFRVQDSYGYTWDSIVGDDLYDYERLNDSWKRNVTSVLNIQYADISGVNPAIKTAFSSEENTAVTSAMQGDTMVITYAFGCGITLSVHAAVQDGTVRFSIPADSIVEDDKNKLLSAELLPYFGASTEEEEGYFFYPDGCGAIKNHYSEASTTIRNMSYTFSLYGSEFNTIDTLLGEQKQGKQTAYLPVFGIKKGDAACIAYSHQGEAESQIVMYPSGASIDLNRIAFSFTYRTSYTIPLSNIDINGKNTAKDINGRRFTEAMMAVDHEVCYAFLGPEQADYSGMAGLYRERLLAEGRLEKSPLIDSFGLSVDLFMGVEENGMFNNALVSVTTAEQAGEILDFCEERGYADSLFTLVGWQKGGWGRFPNAAAVDSAFGGKRGLSALFGRTGAYSGRLVLQTDPFFADSDNGGFSTKKDVIVKGGQSAVTGQNDTLFLLNPAAQARWMEKQRSLFEPLGAGFSLESAGRLLFRDEDDQQPVNKEDAKTQFSALLEKAAQTGYMKLEGANLYGLKYADVVTGLSETSSQYFISDRDVPFVQMVLHGSVAYTNDAGNLSSDFDRQLLRWLELGYTPHFVLTYDNAEKLKYTGYNHLFTSRYDRHADKLDKAYALYTDALSRVTGAYMVSHEWLTADGSVVQVRYDNGVTVIVNYGHAAFETGEYTVGAGSYLLKEGGAA